MKSVCPPIFITGCARSGTSLIAGIVELSGAFGGTTCGRTTANKKGQFENVEIRNGIVKPYLKAIGADPMAQKPLPDVEHLEPFNELREAIMNVICRHGYRSGPWYYKGAKMCLLFPLFHKAFPHAKWIIVRRNDEDIIDSCLRTSFMKKCKGKEGWQRWVDHHKYCFELMKKSDLWTKEICPSIFMSGNFEAIKTLITEDLGLCWNQKKIEEFVDPSMYTIK